jgi:hypothetical protein
MVHLSRPVIRSKTNRFAMRRKIERRSMDCARYFAIAGLIAVGIPLAALAADSGKIVYGTGNCFIIETAKGNTLFERSGGQSPKSGDTIGGVLHDFGYQQLYDAGGKELMVGFVQEFGVKKTDSIEVFKKSCR